MVRRHKEAGYVHIVLKKNLRDRLDRLRVSTPGGKESFASTIARLLDELELARGVNTKTTEPVKRVNTKTRTRIAGVNTRGVSLEDAVGMVERRRKGRKAPKPR
jgi:hypothetical protein